MNIFEYAVRNGLRFETVRGQISVEDLLKLPLKSNNGFNLDAVAQTIYGKLNETKTISFVDSVETSVDTDNQMAFELVKTVIAEKKAAKQAEAERQAKSVERQRLMDILAQKENDAINELSVDEIKARLNALDS